MIRIAKLYFDSDNKLDSFIYYEKILIHFKEYLLNDKENLLLVLQNIIDLQNKLFENNSIEKFEIQYLFEFLFFLLKRWNYTYLDPIILPH